MSVQSEIDRIKGNIASAYQAVAQMGGQAPEQQISGGLADAIRTIPKGGGASQGWVRPSDWPDYSKISLDGFEGMYFTYDTSRAASDPTEFCAFTVTTQGNKPYLVERGQIIGSEFVAEESHSANSGTKFAEWLSSTESGYVVYRVTSEAPIIRMQMSPSDKYDSGERTSYTQHCVERYGRLPNVTGFSGWRLSYVVSEMILDCKKMTNLSDCWRGCSSLASLDLSGWDTSAVTGLNNCWWNCSSLASLNLSGWDTSAMASLSNCWYNCSSLISLDLSGWDTSAVTSLSNCWYNCSSLISLDLSGWEPSAVTSLSNCWNGCSSLMRLKFCPIHISFSLSSSPNLTTASLENVLENLPVVGTNQTATIGAANKAKLTEAQIAAASEKGWNIA